MKSKWICSILVVLMVFTGMVFTGCCKSKCADNADLNPCVVLPKHFKVMTGLGDGDFDSQGWPRYIVNCKDGSVMTLIPETCFVLGANGREPNEQPSHRVAVGRYYIDLYEVNNAQFNRFAKHARRLCFKKDDPALANDLLSTETPECWLERNCGPCRNPCLKSDTTRIPGAVQLDVNYFKEYWSPNVNDNQPARAVSYWEAWYYCRWVGKDLPTEAEWELAAKGQECRLYPWGNTEPDSQHLYCNYAGEKPTEDGFHYAAPVSAFGAGKSPYGCYNMAGNVWEWCKDQYDATEYSVATFPSRPARKRAEAIREFNEPKGTAFGDLRVIRGGAYTSDIADCRTTVRQAAPANFHGMNIGFRGVLRIR